MPNVFVTHADGDFLPAADWNNSFSLVETSFLDLGSFLVSGLTFAAGSGLSVNVAAGHAIIGADITFAAPFVISSLTNGTVNHLYVLQNGTGTSNTTGTAPANSAKLGTCVTAGGVVTSVDMTVTSGRQVRGWIVGSGAGVVYGFLRYAFPADANQVLSAAQSQNEHLLLSGTVTGTKTLTVSALAGSSWWVVNGTSAGIVTLIAATGTGISVANGKTARVLWDGVNMARITPDL